MNDEDEAIWLRATAHAYARIAARVLGETIAAFQLAEEDPAVIRDLRSAYTAAYRAAHGEEPS